MTAAVFVVPCFVSSAPPITVQLHDQSVYKAVANGTALASYTIASSGNVVASPVGTLEAWLTGAGAGSSAYEVMAALSSGSAVTGSLGTWLNCGSSNVWSISNSAQDNSVHTGVITVQIRDVATRTVQASASISLSAESDNFR